MRVARISIRNKKSETITLPRALLQEGKGVEGDKNARGGERQLSLLPLFVREQIDNGNMTGLCIPRFTENITYSKEHEFLEGERYRIGDALVQISGTRKKCFPECQNIVKNKPCFLVKYVNYAKIISSGVVRLNDEIETFTALEGDEKLE